MQTIQTSEPQPSIVIRVGFLALLVFVYCFIGRILDVTVPFLRIPLILGSTYAAMAVISGSILTFLKFTPGKALAAFFVWMVFAFPFSVWKGGSLDTVTMTIRAMLMMIGIIALAVTVRQSLQLMYAIGYAVLTAALISLKYGEEVMGRLALDQGTLSDPNAMALTLLVGLPFVLLKAQHSSNIFIRIFMYGCAVLVLACMARTGSRAGLVTLVAMCAVLFFRVSIKGKMMMVASSAAALTVAPLLVSEHLQNRYMTLFNSEGGVESAADSSKARSHLFRRSIELTIQNPLFGVGPGMFAVAEDKDARATYGIKGAWHTTHNTYTQVSSENGIPALVFYAIALLSTLMIPRRLLKTIPASASGDSKKIRDTALALELSLMGFLVGALFLSVAYMGIPYILVGITVAFGASAASVLNASPAIRVLQPAPATGVMQPALAPAPVTDARRPVAGTAAARYARSLGRSTHAL